MGMKKDRNNENLAEAEDLKKKGKNTKGINEELYKAMEKAMAPHSSTLAWKIPRMEEPGGLQSMGLQCRTRLKWLSSSSSIQSYTTIKKGLNDWDNHDGVVTHLEPDILGCEVKWALGKHHYKQS